LKLTINGEKRDVEGITTVSGLLASFRLEKKILVIELNRKIIDRAAYGETLLKDGDSIEIVHFVGGG
jgi:sulfur carrier protein